MKSSRKRVLRAIAGILAVGTLAGAALASPLAAAAKAGKAPIGIDVESEGAQFCMGDFNLALMGGSDSGKMTCTRSFGASGTTPEGQSFDTVRGTDILKGGAGKLVIRFSARIFPVPRSYEVWTGTWSIVRGTGKYAALRGGGRFAAVSQVCCSLSNRYSGLFTGP